MRRIQIYAVQIIAIMLHALRTTAIRYTKHIFEEAKNSVIFSNPAAQTVAARYATTFSCLLRFIYVCNFCFLLNNSCELASESNKICIKSIYHLHARQRLKLDFN